MKEVFSNYIKQISTKYSYLETSEMGYRSDFEILMKSIFQEIGVQRIDHDAKSFKGNKPDYVIFKQVPILYIEVKDIGVSLDKIEKSEQMSRYFGYDNLILSDYIEFRFYRNGERYQEPIIIAEFDKDRRTIQPKIENYERLATTLVDFAKSHKEPVRSGLQLAKIMGGKGQRIRDNVLDIIHGARDGAQDLIMLFETFKKQLIHDLAIEQFADMYAQTLVYGLFVARYHDESKESFDRREARDLVPASNPLLRHFFDHIIGPDFNKSLKYIVNELAEVFSHSDVEKLMEDYYQKEKRKEGKKGPDPVIHFYEDFLKEYDPELRKKMGAYYTPQPVVSFIIRSVDEILKSEFNLLGGLSDTSKTDNGQHKVQVLDPATGTGTFFSAVIGHIFKGFLEKKQEGRWPTYVHNDLLPRMHGFELMMAPYTIAHLKLSMAFKKTGFKYFNDRLGIYLANSLENNGDQKEIFSSFGFAQSIAREAQEASKIKDQTPIMVVIGNPPYSGVSQNNGKWISNLVNDYKYVEGEYFNERKHWLNDDYVKFIRFAENFIEKNGSGVVAYINPHGFLDNPTFRGMRWHLTRTFDKIYTLDLHGNSKKKETAPDGSKDENVFDIQQGVSINIFIKTKKDNSRSGDVFHCDLYGSRESKFNFLNNNSIKTIDFVKLNLEKPYYFFTPKNNRGQIEYEQGFKTSRLFSLSTTGIVTMGDMFAISSTKDEMVNKLTTFTHHNYSESDLKNMYSLGKNYAKYILANKGSLNIDINKVIPIGYRPFDTRYTYFDNKILWRWRYSVMQHFLEKDNLGITLCRQFKSGKSYQHALITNNIIESSYVSNKTSEITSIFPLYIYGLDGSKSPNLDTDIVNRIKSKVGEFSPEDILDYIYAVLYSPKYRELYKEFLKIDFPHIPYPVARQNFDELVKIGKELRELHLMVSIDVQNASRPYPESGSDIVDKVDYKDGKVYINSIQYFEGVSEVDWNFYIGGYQPAQKWLKDRKGRVLSSEDIEHYQRIIFVLSETNRLMKQIDSIIQL